MPRLKGCSRNVPQNFVTSYMQCEFWGTLTQLLPLVGQIFTMCGILSMTILSNRGDLRHSIRSPRMHRYEACKAITSRNAGINLLRNSGLEELNFRIAESTEHSPYNTEVRERSKTYIHVTDISAEYQLSHVGWTGTPGNDTEQLCGCTAVIPG